MQEIRRYPPLVDAIRAIAYREVRLAGAQFIDEDWVSKKLTRSKLWVRNNWNKNYNDVYEGDIWPPGSHDQSVEEMEVDSESRQERIRRQKYLKNRPQSAPVKCISELPPTDIPLPFIEEDGSGFFRVSEVAKAVLSSIHKPMCVIAIAGKYRTGKSFLMNRLYGRNSGFPLGGTIQSQTKGIWMWQRPHPDDPEKSLLLLDTEGLYDVEKGDSTHDMKLFTLAILLSSVIVFNVQCTIDDAMIQQLHLVSKLTETIKSKNSFTEETGEEFSKFFPTFIMVVRDFFLELKINGAPCTENQYLEHALKLKPGHSQETKNYNEPRNCIKEFFSRRKCFVLPKPIDDNEKLRNLDNVHEDHLKVEFMQKADVAVKAILKEAGIFKVNSDIITASRFPELASVYVDTLNNGGIPCIESAVTMLREVEGRKAHEEALNHYISIMLSTASQSMPLEIKQLSELHMRAMDEATVVFQRTALFDEEGVMVKALLDELNTTYLDFVRQNEDESTHICQSYLQLSFSKIDNKIEEKYYTKEDGYQEYKEDCDLATTMYMSYPDKGPMSQTVLTKYLQARENEGYTILNSDKALTEAAKEIRREQAEREHQALLAQAEQERNEALRQQMEDEQENNRRMLQKVQREMEDRLSEQRIQHEQLLSEKQQRLEQLRREGNARAAQMQRQVENLRAESRNMSQRQEEARREMQTCQRENQNLLSEIRSLKQSQANTQQRLHEIQARPPVSSGGKKKKCVIM